MTMVTLAGLWLPILLSAVFVFVVSSVIHMVLPVHKGDHAPLPDEASLLEALRGHGLSPGEYVFPHPGSMKEMGSPAMLEKYRLGPVGYMTVLPNGPPAIGKSLLWWFLYSLLVGVFVGYVASHALAPGAEYLKVFQVAGTVAVLGYGVTYVPDSIWKGHPWSLTFKFVIDGVIYGLVTAGTFAWLWPAAA